MVAVNVMATKTTFDHHSPMVIKRNLVNNQKKFGWELKKLIYKINSGN